MSDHICHASGCPTPVPPKMFACRKHWFMLPKMYRDAIWNAYRPGQEVRKDAVEAITGRIAEETGCTIMRGHPIDDTDPNNR
jgi:hypothetical protein